MSARTDKMLHALNLALDQLTQYQRYAQEMSKTGRGFSPSSEFTEQSTLIVIESAIRAGGKS